MILSLEGWNNSLKSNVRYNECENYYQQYTTREITMKKFTGIVTIVALLAFVSSIYACGEDKASSKASKASFNSSCSANSAKILKAELKPGDTKITTANVVKTGSRACFPKANKTTSGNACGAKATKVSAPAEKVETLELSPKQNSLKKAEASKTKRDLAENKSKESLIN